MAATIPTPVTRPRFAAHLWLLALLMLLALARAPYAATHLDFARDVFVAWRFLGGEEVPLAGPVLAATIHLGPAWYWLLAALLALVRSWLGVVLLLGLLSALQYPLAYLAGKELHSRRSGVLWAVLLALPSWSAFEWLLPQHYVLTAPLVLAVLLCLLRFQREPRGKYLAGMALGLVLAVHAHPSSVGLAWPVLAVLLPTAWQRRLSWRALLLAGALALLPLLPYLLWSWNNDFADFRAGSAYLSDGRSTGSLANLASVLYQSIYGGALYWLDTMLRLPRSAALAALFLAAALSAVAALGLWQLRRQPGGTARALQVLAAIAAIALTTALIRAETTYYMTAPLRVAALGGIALGLAAWGGRRGVIWTQAVLVVLVLAFNALTLQAANRYLVRGDWPFDFAALFNVTGPGAAPQKLPLLPAYAMRASGEFLCSQRLPSVHGAYARHLLHDYAIEMRLACDRSDAQAGGSDPARQHWLGLARALAADARLASAQRIGPLLLFPVRRVLTGDAFDMPKTPVYPIHLPRTNALETRSFRLELQPGERIAVSEMAFFIGAAGVEFRSDGPLPRLLAADAVSRVYACEDCGTAPLQLELRLTTPNFSDTDVVIF